MITRYPMIVIWALVAGCSQSSDQAATTDSGRASGISLSNAPPDTSIGSKSGTASPCPRTGKWALCSVKKRLEQSGFVVRPIPGDAPRHAGFSVAPAAYTLGKSRLEAFIYPDETSLSRDVAELDTVTAAPRGTAGHWPGT